MARTGRPRKENTKRNITGFRQTDAGKLMLKFLAKEKNSNTTDYLNNMILDKFINSKGYRRGRPFYCVETGDVFSSGKECCEKYGITINELNSCLYDGVSAHGYTFEFIL